MDIVFVKPDVPIFDKKQRFGNCKSDHLTPTLSAVNVPLILLGKSGRLGEVSKVRKPSGRIEFIRTCYLVSGANNEA